MRMLAPLTNGPWMPPYLSICVSGFVLGAAAATSVLVIGLYVAGAISNFAWVGVSVYTLVTLVMFHGLEFACAVLYRPHDSSPDSFLFFHSHAFLAAHAAAWTELLVRSFWLGTDSAASAWWRIALFAILSVGFYGIRVKAMVDAGSNFSFIIETSKRPTHRLVTTGMYATLRHPSYFGSFWYFLCTQAMAGNWVCLLMFAIVLRRFFKERIEEEEQLLEGADFFGEEYTVYKKTSIVGIPILNAPPFFA